MFSPEHFLPMRGVLLRGAFLAEQTLTESKTAEQQPTHGCKRAQDQQGSELVKVGPDKELHNPQDN